jgi:hypothetical protein
VSGAPAEIRWDNQASDFIDFLVENDIRYVGLQESIERLVHSGQKHRIAIALAVVEGETVYWHPVPQLFPRMRSIHVFWVEDDDGGITVIHATFPHWQNVHTD